VVAETLSFPSNVGDSGRAMTGRLATSASTASVPVEKDDSEPFEFDLSLSIR
jgi:hypothetical protein